MPREGSSAARPMHGVALIEPGAEHDQQIEIGRRGSASLACRAGIAEHAERQRMIFREHAFGPQRGGDQESEKRSASSYQCLRRSRHARRRRRQGSQLQRRLLACCRRANARSARPPPCRRRCRAHETAPDRARHGRRRCRRSARHGQREMHRAATAAPIISVRRGRNR